MLGSWHPSNALTFAGIATAVLGIALAITERPAAAVACLVVAGLCDLFDGTFARRFERDERTRAMGAQLDSLADMVGFVALPVTLAASLGATSPWQLAVLVGYALAAVNRLAWFNLDQHPEGTRTHYRGLPVTWAALVVGLVALASHWLGVWLDEVLAATLCLLALAFVTDVGVPRPRGLALIVLLVIALAMLVALALGIPVGGAT